jgi:RNA polymerase sigma factor (sigma-70 family)
MVKVRLSPSIALLRTQSDERLVKLAQEGSDAAFATIVERHRRTVLAACRRILPDARAEDAAQQVFLSAWRALGRGDAVRDVRPWLLRIARNTSLNALRVQGYDYDELRDGLRTGDAPEDEVERRDVIRQTLAGLAALPERQREVLLRSAVEGVAHAEIARDLGLSEGATRQLMLRARTTLRAACSALTPWPLVSWAAQAGGGAAAGAAASGGASALVAKVGTAAVLAGGIAVGTPAVVDHHRPAPQRAAAAPAAVVAAPAAIEEVLAEEPPARAAVPVGTGRPAARRRAEQRGTSRRGRRGAGSGTAPAAGDDVVERDVPGAATDDRLSRHGGSDEGSSGGDSSGKGSDDSDHREDDSSGSGSSGSGSSGSGSSGSGSDDDPADDSSGSGSHDDPADDSSADDSSGSGSDDAEKPDSGSDDALPDDGDRSGSGHGGDDDLPPGA